MLLWRPTQLVGWCVAGVLAAAGCSTGGGSSDFLELLPRGPCEEPPSGEEEDCCLTWELGNEAIDGDDEDCLLECPRGGSTGPIAVHFDCTQIHVVSCKDLSNVVLDLDDGEHCKIDDLDQGQYGTFECDGRTIVGAWVKAGDNASGDGPGYGERFDSPLDPDEDCDGTGGSGGMGGAGGEGGSAGEGGAGGTGGAGGVGGMAGGGGGGGTGGSVCIPDGDAQGADDVVNRPCGTSDCGPMQVCVGGACEAAALVFVSTTWSDAALGGPRGADKTCAELAEAAGLGGYWFSWTSDPCTSPYKRFEKSTLPYRMLDGTQIASSWERLTNRPEFDFNLENNLDMDQNGDIPGEVDQVTNLPTGQACPAPRSTAPNGCWVWTNTTIEGRVHALDHNNGCLGLITSDSIFAPSAVGQMTSVATSWSEGVTRNCGIDGGRIYCFEQPTADPMP